MGKKTEKQEQTQASAPEKDEIQEPQEGSSQESETQEQEQEQDATAPIRIQPGHNLLGRKDCRMKAIFETVREYAIAEEECILPTGQHIRAGDVIGHTYDGKFVGMSKDLFDFLYDYN